MYSNEIFMCFSPEVSSSCMSYLAVMKRQHKTLTIICGLSEYQNCCLDAASAEVKLVM